MKWLLLLDCRYGTETETLGSFSYSDTSIRLLYGRICWGFKAAVSYLSIILHFFSPAVPQSHTYFRMFGPLFSDPGSCWAALSKNVRPAQKSLVAQRVLQMSTRSKAHEWLSLSSLYVVEFMDSGDLSRRQGEGGRAPGTWPAEGKRSRSTHFHPQGEIWGCEDAPRRWNPFSWVKLAPVLRWSGGQQHQKPPQGRESHSHTIKHSYYPCFIRSLVGKPLQYIESMCWEHIHS